VPVPFAGGEMILIRPSFSSEYNNECALRFRLDWPAFKAAAGNCPHAHLVLKEKIGDEAPKQIFGGSYRP